MEPDLIKLYRKVDACRFCQRDGNALRHIHGFGPIRPKWMFVLVNPTHRNISSAPDYRGPRFPFVGVRSFWRVLADGGAMSRARVGDLPPRAEWLPTHTERIQAELVRNGIFLTNVVKCCYDHGDYPERRVVDGHLPTLAEEIRIVKPSNIVAFGGFVHKTLTGNAVTLSDYWRSPKGDPEREILSGLNVPVVPCYFPVGRGNPKKAAETLRTIFQTYAL